MNKTAEFEITELFDAQGLTYEEIVADESPEELYVRLTDIYGSLRFTEDQLGQYIEEGRYPALSQR